MNEHSNAPDWSQPLWDTDGDQHQLVAKVGPHVVTTVRRLGVAVWDRRSGEMLFPAQDGNRVATIGGPYRLRNQPLSQQEQARKDQAAGICMELMHADRAMFCIAANRADGMGSLFIGGPFASLALAEAEKASPEHVIFRVRQGEAPSTEFCDVCGCDTSTRMQSHAVYCPNFPL